MQKWEKKLGKFNYNEAVKLGKSTTNVDQVTQIVNEIEFQDGYNSTLWLQNLSTHLHPVIRTMRPFILWVAMALRCAPDEVAFFWGVFRLLVMVWEYFLPGPLQSESTY